MMRESPEPTNISELYSYLKALKEKSNTRSEWSRQSQIVFEDRRLRAIAHECPFTRRAYEKPRGYAGDAPTLDYIYGIETPESLCPTAGSSAASVFNFTTNIPATRAVRYRRRLLAGLCDEVARNRDGARVLSIASGHLREIEFSEAANQHCITEWRAFDQDCLSVSYLRSAYENLGVVPQQGSIRSLIRGDLELGSFDFSYTAGLLDYLNDDQAEALIGRMIGCTNENGVVLVANFVPGIPDEAYMETFMKWRLLFRSSRDIRRLFNRCWSEQLSDLKLFTDPDENIIFAKAVVK